MSEQLAQAWEKVSWIGVTSKEVAKCLGQLFALHDPDLQVLVTCVFEALASGHTAWDLELGPVDHLGSSEGAVVADLVELQQAWPTKEGWLEKIDASGISSGDAPGLICVQQRLLAIPRTYRCELYLAHWLRARHQVDHLEFDVSQAAAAWDLLLQAQGQSKTRLSAMQEVAVLHGALLPLTVLTGGPGTGKTTTVVRMLAYLQLLRVVARRPLATVALVAPTGKAAARMAESVRDALSQMSLPSAVVQSLSLPAQTIHRLIGVGNSWWPRTKHHAGSWVVADVVVVDECSMVDSELMARLCDALPASAQIVFVGDHQQLPSVDAGAVMADLCGSDPKWVGPAQLKSYVERLGLQATQKVDLEDAHASDQALSSAIVALDVSHRQRGQSAIISLARAVLAGDLQAVLDLLRSGTPEILWLDPAAVGERLDARFADLAVSGYRSLQQANSAIERVTAGQRAFRILVPGRAGAWGVDTLNQRTRGLLHSRFERVCEPMMISENDYEVGLFNGDLGVMSQQGLRSVVEFPEGGGTVRALARSRLRAIEPAYAMTIHKSQGSEFETVYLILDHLRPLWATREVLFTGITRARGRLVLQATVESLADCLKRKTGRITLLGRMLRS